MFNTLSIFGVPVGFGPMTVPASVENYEYAKRLYAITEELVVDGKLRVHPPRVCKLGLEGVFDAIELAKAGEANGVKLVVKL